MTQNRRLAVGGLVLGLTVGWGEARASFYPPSYVTETQCKREGPVEVCTWNRRWGMPQLVIKYTGPLMTTQWGRISVYAKLNGRDGVFRLANASYVESIVLGKPQEEYICQVLDSNRPGDMPPPPTRVCPLPAVPGGGPPQWYFVPAPAAQLGLFFYARNPFGVANNWDVEVAFVSEDGQWDSKGGANYRFTFGD